MIEATILYSVRSYADIGTLNQSDRVRSSGSSLAKLKVQSATTTILLLELLINPLLHQIGNFAF